MANLAAAAERILASAPIIAPADPVVVEGKKRFSLALESELLDYKHNHPVHIENCAALLIKIFGNVLDHPDEAKYRQIKASGNTFKTQVANVKGGEHLMTLAGWKVQVVELERFLVFDGEPGSHKAQILAEARALLQRALATIHEKAERKRHENEAKAAFEKQQRAAVVAALEEDKERRKLRPPVVAPSPATSPGQATAVTAMRSPSASPSRRRRGAGAGAVGGVGSGQGHRLGGGAEGANAGSSGQEVGREEGGQGGLGVEGRLGPEQGQGSPAQGLAVVGQGVGRLARSMAKEQESGG
ncbi:hypothetical protein V8C86DRAFT_3131780 [Haematococcus lacustris]